MTESEKEKLEKLKRKMAEMKEQERAIIAKDKSRQKKERTRRLIQNGTLVDKYFGHENIKPEELEKLLISIVNLPLIKEIINKS